MLEIVGASLEGGASIVQLRDKKVFTLEEKIEAARGLRQLCNRYHVPFIVNDDPELARRFGADGVHVGREDPSPRIARSEEHTSELQSRGHLVCRLLLEKKKTHTSA